jgi:hypothetical protein
MLQLALKSGQIAHERIQLLQLRVAIQQIGIGERLTALYCGRMRLREIDRMVVTSLGVYLLEWEEFRSIRFSILVVKDLCSPLGNRDHANAVSTCVLN